MPNYLVWLANLPAQRHRRLCQPQLLRWRPRRLFCPGSTSASSRSRTEDSVRCYASSISPPVFTPPSDRSQLRTSFWRRVIATIAKALTRGRAARRQHLSPTSPRVAKTRSLARRLPRDRRPSSPRFSSVKPVRHHRRTLLRQPRSNRSRLSGARFTISLRGHTRCLPRPL